MYNRKLIRKIEHDYNSKFQHFKKCSCEKPKWEIVMQSSEEKQTEIKNN
jgi:hypothetical protein